MVEIIKIVLITIAVILTFCLTLVKGKSNSVSKRIITIDKQIIILESRKKLLNIELTYLTSPQRILGIIEKYPNILGNKSELKIAQIQTKEQFERFAKNRVIKNRMITSNKTEKKG